MSWRVHNIELIGRRRVARCPVISAYFLLATTVVAQSVSGYHDWKANGGGPANIHYSALTQINRHNVAQLHVAWTYETHDEYPDSEIECNPIVVDGRLYATSPRMRVIALDAATGSLRWQFDPNEGRKVTGKHRNRGLTFWASGADRRIFLIAGSFLYALNADTGSPIKGFGQGGQADLREGLDRPPETIAISATSPGIIYRDLLIVGSSVSEDLPAAPGDIRAYDVRTGKLRWTFHTLPHPGEVGYDTWPKDAWKYSGGVNNWAGMSVDEKRGIVFVPTGSAAFDFYGANRAGDNLFANTLLALRADTGERVWHFQAVKHDTWDRDFPAAPSLVTVKRDGKPVDAVAQITKSGHLFLLECATGKPLFPIEYRAVPASDVDGEKLSVTQPLPTLPIPFARQSFSEKDATNRTPEAHRAVLDRLRQVRSNGQFTPPSLQGTVIFPGFDGGGEWGGGSFDPETGLFYVNSNEMPWILRLVERQIPNSASTARSVYRSYCASCHREDRTGTPPEFPALVGIGARYTESEISGIIRKGVGRMPAFAQFSAADALTIATYLATGQDGAVGPHVPSPMDLKYRHDGYNKFLDPDGYPAIEPPWGTLNAIDLNTGLFAWKIPFGEYPELVEKGMRNTGSENYGGSAVTAGGLLFIGATDRDRKFHAYDKATGELLWETTLPAAGNATPAIYEVRGREFVVIAAGGGKWGSLSGGAYVAFALPRK
jgi:quinoprotein glucose dehydrogenase